MADISCPIPHSLPPSFHSHSQSMEYHLYLPHTAHNTLHAYRIAFLQLTEKYTSTYLWNKQHFSLRLHNDSHIPHLWGKLKFGENIEDEWFVVFLLWELSKDFEDLVISVTDEDGQFLLIEAALAIPSWMNPENSENRVFIHRGAVHIIPLPSTPAQLMTIPAKLSLETALELVRNENISTKASEEVQKCILNRISCFPSQILEHQHHVRCLLPLAVAQVLKLHPHLVALAVEAFCQRDLIGMKYCSKMEKFLEASTEKEGRSGKRVMVMVTLTRCLYAQLVKQQFYPPKVFGPQPPPSHPDARAFDIGVKIACGFEILYQEEKRKQSRKEKDSSPREKFHESPGDWSSIEQSLQEIGYFNSSRSNEELLQRAKEIWQRKELNALDLMDQAFTQEYSVSDFSDSVLHQDDDDSWMDITFNELDELLAQREAELKDFDQRKSTTANGEDAEIEKLSTMIRKMKSFVSGVSSYEGVETTELNQGEINLDMENLLSVVKKTFGAGQEDSSGSEEEDLDFDLDEGGEMDSMQQMMAQMDQELVHNPSLSREEGEAEGLSVDYRVVKNLLESFSSQHGLPGPVSNILGSMSQR